MAASTGGPQALHELLAALPAGLAVPILVVQHIAKGFTKGLVDWLNTAISLPVWVAEHGALPRPGHVYVAGEDAHLELRRGRLHLTASGPVAGHLPSADVLLSSVAADARDRSLAVVLTGMGRDGAEGALAVHRAGWRRAPHSGGGPGHRTR
jgi:two-component system chemotaxis response regulator CheB